MLIMYVHNREELIQTQAEQLSEILCGASYFDLSPELRLWVRDQAIEALWPEQPEQDLVAAA